MHGTVYRLIIFDESEQEDTPDKEIGNSQIH